MFWPVSGLDSTPTEFPILDVGRGFPIMILTASIFLPDIAKKPQMNTTKKIRNPVWEGFDMVYRYQNQIISTEKRSAVSEGVSDADTNINNAIPNVEKRRESGEVRRGFSFFGARYFRWNREFRGVERGFLVPILTEKMRYPVSEAEIPTETRYRRGSKRFSLSSEPDTSDGISNSGVGRRFLVPIRTVLTQYPVSGPRK